MLAPAFAAIKSFVEGGYSALPVHWPNTLWPADANPRDVSAPFVEVEIIGGRNALHAFSTPGSRLFIHPGLIRFYVFAPEGQGLDDALATADQLSALMERKEFGRSGSQVVRTQDFSVYDDVAADADGNYAVLMCSVPFDFYYEN